MPAKATKWRAVAPSRFKNSFLSTIRPNRTESFKRVLVQSRASVSLYNTIHILPVLICATLIILNSYTLFVTGPKKWIPLLQFAAKVHETLMQASIAAITLDYMRALLLKEEVVPFGAIFPAVSTNKFSTLWSTELWAAGSAKCFDRRRRAAFLALIPFSILLAAVVGPASAIAMVPRNVDYQLGHAIVVLNASRDVIAPSRFTEALVNKNCSSRTVATQMAYRDCPATNMNAVRGLPDFVFPVSNGESISNFVTLNVDQRRAFDMNYQVFGTIATAEPYTQIDTLTWVSTRWWAYQQSLSPTQVLTTTGIIQKPLVVVSCHEEWANQTDSNFEFAFGVDRVRAKQPAILQTLFANFTEPPSRGDIIWLEPDSAMASNVSLLAAVVRPRRTNSLWPDSIDQFCTIKAWWVEAEAEVSNRAVGPDHVTAPTQDTVSALWLSNANRPVITIDPAWAKYLLPFGDTKPSLEQDIRDINDNHYYHEWAQGPFLARIVTMGIINYWSTPNPQYDLHVETPSALYDPLIDLVHLGQWQSPDTTSGELFQGMPRGFGANQSGDGLMTLHDEQSGLFDDGTWRDKFTITTRFSAKGLAYSLDGAPIKISMTVLGIYMLFALLYVAYSTKRGISSSAWTSVSELVALALNSQRPTILENTSAGIDAHTTYQQPVCVRESDSHGVQFVFKEDLDGQREHFKPVQVNKLY